MSEPLFYADLFINFKVLLENLILVIHLKILLNIMKLDFPLLFSAVVGMVCTSPSQCTDLLPNTDCLLSQCACNYGYTGTTCTGKA